MNESDALLNWAGLRRNLAIYRDQFAHAEPFRYVIMDDVLRDDAVREIEAGFATALSHKNHGSAKSHRNVLKKVGTPNLQMMTPRQVQFFEEINSPEFVGFLTELTGITPILGDMELRGGGLHSSVQGGYLNVHTDFNFHPVTNMHRRLNLILYANSVWEEDWGGALELWSSDVSECRAKVFPKFNRAVLFETSEISFHGHPEPMTCPEGVSRKSLAVYYYSDWPAKLEQRAKTNYVLTPVQLQDLKNEIRSAINNGAQTFEQASEMISRFQPAHVKQVFPLIQREMR